MARSFARHTPNLCLWDKSVYCIPSKRCRTAALGGHPERCDQCGHERNAYNSCADLHCPKCQSLARAKWLEKRQAELLDCEYFHVVFTLPPELATLALQNKRLE